MIDQGTDEILSRYLDGDLGIDEDRRIVERLKSEPALQEALDEMRSLRNRLRRLALEERPPEVLDRMVRPLRRGGRPRRQRWVAVALFAAAAVVVVGLIVVSEVGQTGWMPWEGNSGEKDRQVFALSSLPSRDPEAPLGAIESLMAQPDPEPEMVEPEALEVMGPLNRPPEGQGWALRLEAGGIVVPLSGSIETQGLRVTLRIEGGRVASCRCQDGAEAGPAVGDVCRQLLSIGGIGLHDGQYEATTVRWDDQAVAAQ